MLLDCLISCSLGRNDEHSQLVTDGPAADDENTEERSASKANKDALGLAKDSSWGTEDGLDNFETGEEWDQEKKGGDADDAMFDKFDSGLTSFEGKGGQGDSESLKEVFS
jgi:hypothetical protein